MVANSSRAFFLVGLLGFTAVSYAGIERFWVLLGRDTPDEIKECDNLTHEQQQQLIQTYQSLRDEEKKLDLKKRMDWFCQLPDQQQQQMREAWQNMSSTERNQLKQRLDTATDASERAEIRREFLTKYALENN